MSEGGRGRGGRVAERGGCKDARWMVALDTISCFTVLGAGGEGEEGGGCVCGSVCVCAREKERACVCLSALASQTGEHVRAEQGKAAELQT